MKQYFSTAIFSREISVPLRITITYFTVGAVWILLSDKILWMLVSNPASLTAISIIKGWFFVGSTSLMLYILISRSAARIEQSEKEARQAEAEYREVVDIANIIIIRRDARGHITLFNQFAQDFFGYDQQEILGRNAIGTIVPEAEDTGHESEKTNLDMGENPEQCTRTIAENMTKNGNRIWVAWTNKPILDQHGRLEGFLCIGNDVTAHKLTEEALRETEQRFQDILNRAPSAVYIKDPQGRYTFINSHFERLSGFWREQVIDRTDFDLFPQDVAQQSARNDQKAFEMQIPLEIEEIAPVGGEMHTFISAKFPLYDSRGGAYAICGISTDINQRKRAERKSNDMVRFMRTLLDTIPSPIFYEDNTGQFLGCNNAFESYLDLRKEQIVGKYAADIAPDDPVHKALTKDSISGRQPGKQGYESQVLYADGHKHDMICNLATFLDAEGTVAGLVGVMTDITERKSAEMEREKLIGELQDALSKVRLLSGFLPICASCKKIRDDKGYWRQIEAYIRDHSEVEFSHSVCPDCVKKLYPELGSKR